MLITEYDALPFDTIGQCHIVLYVLALKRIFTVVLNQQKRLFFSQLLLLF